jgi:hypothetical protein
MDSNPQSLQNDRTEEKDFFTFGSLVDCLAYTPDLFDYRFYITPIPKPGDAMGKWLDEFMAVELPPDYKLVDVTEVILQARAKVQYQMNWKAETVLAKFEEVCFPYLDVLAKAGDRLVITQADYDKAQSYIARLVSNDYVGKYFMKREKNVELQFQVPCYFEIEDVPFKSLLDCIYIDHNAKTITVVDLKTTSKPLSDFEHSFISYRYYIQAALYQEAIRQTHQDVLVRGYKVSNETLFIVINDFEAPMIWVAPAQMISTAWVGGITRYGKKIKGIHQLIEEFKWHTENNLFDYPASVYQNEGKRVIDVL